MTQNLDGIKSQIMTVLDHPEAEDGLYFRNFYQLHEEDSRTPVKGSELEILEALKQLIQEGQVDTDESGEEVIFFRSKKN